MTIRKTLAIAVSGLLGLTSACAGPERATHVDSRQSTRDANERLERGQENRGADVGDRQGGRTNPDDLGPADRVAGGDAAGERGERPAGAPDGHEAEDPADESDNTPAASAVSADWKAVADELVADLAQHRDRLRGPVLVFPPFGRTTAANEYDGCALGDDIADRVVSGLQVRDIEAVSGGRLRDWIGEVNAGLSQFPNDRDPSGPVQVLAGRIADYFAASAVVFGTLEQRRADGIGRAKPIRLEMSARSLSRGAGLLADVDQRWKTRGDDYDDVLEGLEDPGTWRIGRHAPSFTPQVDKEMELLVAKALADFIDDDLEAKDREARMLLGRRVLVMPFQLRGQDHAADVRALTRDIAERLGRLQERMGRDGQPVAASAVMDVKLDRPVQIGGRDYLTIGESLEALRALQRQQARTDAGVISQEYEARISGILERLGRGEIEVVRLDNREMVLAQIEAESFEYQRSQGVDPDSIPFSQSNAPDVLLRVGVGGGVDSWSMRISLVEMRNPNNQRSTSFNLNGWIVERLRNAMGDG